MHVTDQCRSAVYLWRCLPTPCMCGVRTSSFPCWRRRRRSLHCTPLPLATLDFYLRMWKLSYLIVIVHCSYWKLCSFHINDKRIHPDSIPVLLNIIFQLNTLRWRKRYKYYLLRINIWLSINYLYYIYSLY